MEIPEVKITRGWELLVLFLCILWLLVSSVRKRVPGQTSRYYSIHQKKTLHHIYLLCSAAVTHSSTVSLQHCSFHWHCDLMKMSFNSGFGLIYCAEPYFFFYEIIRKSLLK